MDVTRNPALQHSNLEKESSYNIFNRKQDTMPALRINISFERLQNFCQTYHVSQLSLFGSVLRDDFLEESDVDVLVQFEPGTRLGFMTLGKMQRELEAIFGRPVDLVPQDGLKPVIRDAVLSSAQVVYAA